MRRIILVAALAGLLGACVPSRGPIHGPPGYYIGIVFVPVCCDRPGPTIPIGGGGQTTGIPLF